MLDCREQTSDCLAVAIKSLFFFLLSPTLVSSCVVYKMNGALNEGIEQWEAVSLCCKGLRGKGWSLKTPWHPFSWLFKHQTTVISYQHKAYIWLCGNTKSTHQNSCWYVQTQRDLQVQQMWDSATQCKKKQLACGRGQDKLLMRHCWMCCWGENNYVILAHHRLQQIFCPRCKNRQEEDSSTGEKNKQLFYKLFSLQLSPSLATRDINHKPPKCI